MIQHLNQLITLAEIVAVEKALVLQGAQKDTTDLEKYSAELKEYKSNFLKMYAGVDTIQDDNNSTIHINERHEK